MIFQATWHKVKAGNKWKSRRKIKAWYALTEAGVIGRNGRPLYAVGSVHAVTPGRGKKAVCYVLIENIRKVQRAGDISPVDAIAEGFKTPEEFRTAYATLNGEKALDEPCFEFTFKLAERKKRR